MKNFKFTINGNVYEVVIEAPENAKNLINFLAPKIKAFGEQSQDFLEKMGGGGHITLAGAQVTGMTLEEAKQQLVNRYRYLYENAFLILAPYMYEQTEEEYQKSVDDYIKQFGRSIIDKPSIYLKINRLDSVNSIFEEFLLSDKKLEDTELYKFIESKRNDKEYLEQVKRGIELTDKKNIERCEITKESLNIWKILNSTWDYVSEQSGDLKNKESKLRVLDEYYRIARYKNNGKIYKSGRNLTLDESWGGIIVDKKREPFRDKKDIGITNNFFIMEIY